MRIMTATSPTANPFHTSPNPLLLYVTPSLGETMDKVRYVVDSRQGLTVIYGEVGHGKSSLLRYLYNEYDVRDDVTAVMIYNPDSETELGLLKVICGELGVPRKRTKIDQQSALRAFLIDQYAQRKNVVVFIDEAQIIRGRVLELIRALLNFETDTAKLIQIVLCGQLELRDRLRDPSKRALRSRIILTSTLDPLSPAETRSMIQFRLDRGRYPHRFEEAALDFVYQTSLGVPREVLKLCGTAFNMAQVNGLTQIPLALVEYAAKHVEPS
jgi:general secretion pathway protein A